MSTFKAKFCAHHGCPPSAFARKVLWRTLPYPLLPFALMGLLLRRPAFAADLRLIEFCGEARDSLGIRDEIAGYFSEAFCWNFLRRRLHCRISTFKLKRLARRYLKASGGTDGKSLGEYLAVV